MEAVLFVTPERVRAEFNADTLEQMLEPVVDLFGEDIAIVSASYYEAFNPGEMILRAIGGDVRKEAVYINPVLGEIVPPSLSPKGAVPGAAVEYLRGQKARCVVVVTDKVSILLILMKMGVRALTFPPGDWMLFMLDVLQN